MGYYIQTICNKFYNKFLYIGGMENLLDRISINPDICNGKPILKGMRITVKTVLEYLAAGESQENILKSYPFLDSKDILACIQFASRFLDKDIRSITLPA